MRKHYSLFFVFLFFLFYQSSAQIAGFNFMGSNGDESTWPSAFTGTGVGACSVERGAGVTGIANADRFNSKGWTTAAYPDPDDYIEFVISPQTGYSVTISTITLQHQRSSTGPKSFVIRTSLNNFSENATNEVVIPDINTNQTSLFSFPSPIVILTPLIIRIYAYQAESENGTWGPGESNDGNDIRVAGSFMILPVRFIHEKATWKNHQVEITWTNATESEVLNYVLERSANGQNFSEIARLSPLSNNGDQVNYKAVDTDPLNKAAYYRIKAIERSGNVIYSRIVKIESAAGSSKMALYPNPLPTGSSLMIQANGLTAGDYTLTIYNAAAQIVHQQTIRLEAGASTQGLYLKNRQKGTYILQLKGAAILQQRFIVQ